jgi:sarcosine oxidase
MIRPSESYRLKSLTKRYNTIVIGVGGMGSATCYELARRGKRVLGLEQYDIPHDLGSSHGHTRIIRLAYYEHPSYVMLLHRSYELWDEIQKLAGEQLLYITGSLDAGPADSWVFKGSWRSCIEHNLPHEVLTGREINKRFPGYQLPHDTMAVLQPKGGFLMPERCIVAYVIAAQALGAEIHGREQVLDWQPISDGVRVTTTRDTYEADTLVVTAGSWNSKLLDFLQGLAVPERQVLAWLQPERPELFRPEIFPVFNLLVEEGRYYGFPIFSVPGFKFGKYHHFEETDDPERMDLEPHDYDEAMLREFAARYFPLGCGPTMSLKSCKFTNTADGHFLIDLHPVYPQISFAAGFSGHGFKFASVIGEIMADLAERGETRHNTDLFRLERLTGQTTRPAGHFHPGQRPARQARSSMSHQSRLSQHGTHEPQRMGPNGFYGYSVLAEDEAGAIKPFW